MSPAPDLARLRALAMAEIAARRVLDSTDNDRDWEHAHAAWKAAAKALTDEINGQGALALLDLVEAGRGDTERIDRLPLTLPHIGRGYNWLEATPELTRAALDLAWNGLATITKERAARHATTAADDCTFVDAAGTRCLLAKNHRGGHESDVTRVGPLRPRFKDFFGNMSWDAESARWFGEVEDIAPDVATFEGATADEAVTAFHDTVDDYLAMKSECAARPAQGKT